MKKILCYLTSFLAICQGSFAATQVNTPNVSGTWTLEGSPYYIHNDIAVPLSNTLTIQPGVQVVFMGNYQLYVYGTISAKGTPEQKIVFRANDTTGWSNVATTAGGWSGLGLENTGSMNFGNPTFEYCIFKDIKRGINNSAITSTIPLLYINQCEFYHNIAMERLISLYNFGQTQSASKLRFTNCSIHDNRTGTLMHVLYEDSAYVLNNKFYNNTSSGGIGLFSHTSTGMMSNNVLLFRDNELYNNTQSNGGGIFNSAYGGNVIFQRNRVHHNNTNLNGAVALQSKSSLIEQNLICNNNQTLAEGVFCGINDGGGGLQLLGQDLDSDVPGRNDHIVRNNIIANNYSSISGGGIWAQHCQATIVNNTIVNNTVKDYTGSAAIHGWGTYCKLRISNNIIFNNKQNYNPFDTAYNNFKFAALNLNLSNNLIDFYPNTNMPAGVQGLSTNIYDHNLQLASPILGAGPNYNALNVDFGLASNSTNCINKGSNAVPDYGSADYNGHTRVFNNTIDIGAVEYQKSVDTSTSLYTPGLANAFRLYPNPGTGIFQLEYDQQKYRLASMELFQLNGRKIKDLGFEAHQPINIQDLPSGVYLLKLRTQDQQVIAKQIILQK
jgi:hypothetical protein